MRQNVIQTKFLNVYNGTDCGRDFPLAQVTFALVDWGNDFYRKRELVSDRPNSALWLHAT